MLAGRRQRTKENGLGIGILRRCVPNLSACCVRCLFISLLENKELLVQTICCCIKACLMSVIVNYDIVFVCSL